jgi:hypothetical protein
MRRALIIPKNLVRAVFKTPIVDYSWLDFSAVSTTRSSPKTMIYRRLLIKNDKWTPSKKAGTKGFGSERCTLNGRG